VHSEFGHQCVRHANAQSSREFWLALSGESYLRMHPDMREGGTF